MIKMQKKIKIEKRIEERTDHGDIEVAVAVLNDGTWGFELIRERTEDDKEYPGYTKFSEDGKHFRTNISMSPEAFKLLRRLISSVERSIVRDFGAERQREFKKMKCIEIGKCPDCGSSLSTSGRCGYCGGVFESELAELKRKREIAWNISFNKHSIITFGVKGE
jgi:hypothetical protein